MASVRKDERISKLEVMLEAARRATWDALHGPLHLRSGRFRPTAVDLSETGHESVARAAQQGVAADGASRRR